MTDVRKKRLQSDCDRVRELVAQSGGTVEISSTSGNPPTLYELTYHCAGVVRVVAERPELRYAHKVQIELGLDYPRIQPRARVLSTPNFNPHVWRDTSVLCLGRWAANEFLDDLVLRIGGIIQLEPRYLNEKSPANREAMDWARENKHLLPVGTCTFRRETRCRGNIQWENL